MTNVNINIKYWYAILNFKDCEWKAHSCFSMSANAADKKNKK